MCGLSAAIGCAGMSDDLVQRVQATRGATTSPSPVASGSGSSSGVDGGIDPQSSARPSATPFRPTPVPTPNPTPRRTLPPEPTDSPTGSPAPTSTPAPTPTPEPTAFPVGVAIWPKIYTLNAQAPGGGNAAGYVSTVQLRAVVTLSDSATNSLVVWTSSDPGRVPVSESGLVTAMASASAGQVVITATTANGLTDTATIEVTRKGRLNAIVR